MKAKSILLLLVSLFITAPVFAQGQGQGTGKVTVSGRVIDDQGAPVIGAGVMVEGTTTGVATDINGNYTITVPSSASLSIQSIGFKTVVIPVRGRARIDVTLSSDDELLDEVVVVGYGTQKKANLTGAVDQVGAETFDGRPNANLAQMLQGRVANLNLKFTDGRPNSSPSFNIRGKTSIGQGGSALVLIDGVEGNASLLNPNDIESVSVLKDAASSAIYGSRAPYGVVLITTKNAKKGTATVSYQTNLSFETPTAMPDVVSDGYVWAEHFYKAWYNSRANNPNNINKTMEFSTAWLEEYRLRAESGNYETLVSDGSLITKGLWLYFHKGTDYYDALYKDFTFTQTHNLSVSGADDRFDYYISARLYDNDGLFDSQVNPDSYKMYNGRVKVGYQVTPWLKITSNTDIAYSKYVMPETQSEGGGNIWRNIADEGHPCSPIFNPDGTLTYSAVYSVGDILYGGSNRTYTNRQAQNTVAAKATFFDNRLRLNADFTYRARSYDTHVHRLPSPFSRYEGQIESLAEIKGLADYISETLRTYDYLATNEWIEWEDTVGKHNFKALLGYNYEQQTYRNVYAYNDGLLSPNVDQLNLALGLDNKSITSDYSKWRMAGAFFRLNYNFAERYLLEINGRYDGSSKFPARQRWAFFPSVSAGWRVSQEPWFNVDQSIISNLKIRASYGSLGNSNVSVYAYDETFDFDNGRIINGQKVRYTSAPAPIPESLTWETAQTLDGGIDLSLFSGRLNFTGDVYVRKTLNMYTVGPTLPDVFGASSPKGNFAEMTTRGFEITLGWDDALKLGGQPFKYGIHATLADYYSVIDKYNNALKSLSTNAYNTSYYEGMVLGEIWGFECDGLYQNQAQIDADEAAAAAAGQAHYNSLMKQTDNYALFPGDMHFVDINKNGYIDRGKNTADDPGDRKIIGNSEPRFIYSFGFDVEWAGIFANAFFQGVGKQDWYPDNESSSFWGMYNRPYNQMPSWHLGNYWTEDNPNAYLPRYTGYFEPFYKGRTNANDRYLQNASYIRLKSVQIGYNIPEKITRKAGLHKVSVFLAGENLWTWSPVYKWSRDVDVTANIYGTDSVLETTGDGYNFPTMKSISVGVKVNFGHIDKQ
ncbi:MAG: TonB-dependent receptor [Bacteroidales bacterium]|nr:TonB-dependent receptor [Bacteroidales bacterium]MBP5521460.1 TonB-dependent receptor [Bacteroidales bacterium]